MKFVSVLFVLALAFPYQSVAQRFGHGGGGGGMRGGGGGGIRNGGGGGNMNRGGGGFRAATPPAGARSINGGGQNLGSHSIFRGQDNRGGRGFFGITRNENAFHHSYGVHPYAYHPYHPYIWGPHWHPFGFFASVLTADAIMFSWANQNYYYDDGVYYLPSNHGYAVVAPPVGAVVTYLPSGYQTVPVGDDTYYYYGGTFYISQGGSFRVVPAPVGAVVTDIPEGATQQVINGENYLLYNNTYYAPISVNGQDAYEVVQVN